jgi:hypothetical protein
MLVVLCAVPLVLWARSGPRAVGAVIGTEVISRGDVIRRDPSAAS